ncbi:hypothetical protein GE061_003961 [Apolygus lucorum]|uniref:Sushi domain-containing protein n=1 Tax=Apolygus lucorum TaxID=248454 RepID=A0A8S9WZC3_APOLU|nr:hypothetical protein GE061_003961 [Apolygus lucorum]
MATSITEVRLDLSRLLKEEIKHELFIRGLRNDGTVKELIPRLNSALASGIQPDKEALKKLDPQTEITLCSERFSELSDSIEVMSFQDKNEMGTAATSMRWAIAPEERDWKYRLSIYYTKPQDSGVFTCATPKGLTNSLNVVITDAQCERIDADTLRPKYRHLRVRSEGTKLGNSVHFHCPTGFRLNGTANLTCRANASS